MKNKYYQNLEAAKLKQPKRIELSVADDIKKIEKEIYSVDEKLLVKNILAPVRKGITEFTKVVKLESKLDSAIKEAKKALKDLGIEPSKAPWLKNAEQTIKTIKNTKQLLSTLKKIESSI